MVAWSIGGYADIMVIISHVVTDCHGSLEWFYATITLAATRRRRLPMIVHHHRHVASRCSLIPLAYYQYCYTPRLRHNAGCVSHGHCYAYRHCRLNKAYRHCHVQLRARDIGTAKGYGNGWFDTIVWRFVTRITLAWRRQPSQTLATMANIVYLGSYANARLTAAR